MHQSLSAFDLKQRNGEANVALNVWMGLLLCDTMLSEGSLCCTSFIKASFQVVLGTLAMPRCSLQN